MEGWQRKLAKLLHEEREAAEALKACRPADWDVLANVLRLEVTRTPNSSKGAKGADEADRSQKWDPGKTPLWGTKAGMDSTAREASAAVGSRICLSYYQRLYLLSCRSYTIITAPARPLSSIRMPHRLLDQKTAINPL